MSRGRDVEEKSLGYSHTITTLACAALLSIWMLSMQSDYEAEQESICIAYHGKGAKWDRRAGRCVKPPIPLPECRKQRDWTQKFGPPTAGQTCHIAENPTNQ